jgi:cell division protein YceG involved in septum cleavage
MIDFLSARVRVSVTTTDTDSSSIALVVVVVVVVVVAAVIILQKQSQMKKKQQRNPKFSKVPVECEMKQGRQCAKNRKTSNCIKADQPRVVRFHWNQLSIATGQYTKEWTSYS